MFIVRNPYRLNTCLKMHTHCPTCKQPFEIEVGFYYGTGYVSYALTVAITIATFIAWWVCVGISINDDRIFWWLGINTFLLIVLQPLLMRLSRSLWISWFVKYEPEWQQYKPDNVERIIPDQMNNW